MKHKLPIALGATVGAILAFFALSASAHAATGCFIGASAGVGASASRLSDGNTSIDIGTSAPMVGAEFGCKVSINQIFVGAIMRYDFMNARTHVDAQTLKSNGRWMALGTVGMNLNESTNGYLVGGISGAKFEIPGMASEAISQWVIGAGISTELWKTGLSAFAEVDALFGKETAFANAKFKDSQIMPRVGIRYSW